MKKAFLMLIALAGVPMVWVLLRCFLEALAIDTTHGSFLTPGKIGFITGCIVMTALFVKASQSLQVVYVFAHEMTHAVVGLCFFAKLHRVSVQATGGFVQLSKSNLLITLAPYCVPFYLILALLLFCGVEYCFNDVIPFWTWSFVFGVCTAFHVWYTANALLSVSQPDTHEYGRFFSWWFILVTNLCFAIGAVVITSDSVTMRGQGNRLIETTQSVYMDVYDGIHGVINRFSTSF
jgi:hypothetical protein